MNNDKIEKVLNYDPLKEAEKCTGNSYKDCEVTSSLGLLLHLHKTQYKNKLLRKNKDTYYSMSWDEFILVVKDLGFESTLLHTFQGQEAKECMYIAWSPDGILLVAETYTVSGKISVNKAKIHYNWVPDRTRIHNEGKHIYQFTSSGMNHCENFHNPDCKIINAGNKDVRDGLRHSVEQMREYGYFMNPWLHASWLIVWMVPYQLPKEIEEAEWNVKSKYFNKINTEMLRKLPEHVRNSIKVKD